MVYLYSTDGENLGEAAVFDIENDPSSSETSHTGLDALA